MNTNQKSSPETFRKFAVSAGILFIIYDLVDILSFLFLGPVTLQLLS